MIEKDGKSVQAATCVTCFVPLGKLACIIYVTSHDANLWTNFIIGDAVNLETIDDMAEGIFTEQ